MTNLGSNDTPVIGEHFSLPAGAQLDEDGGDLVIRDSGGTIILRRDETAGAWDFTGTDMTGVGALDVKTLGNDRKFAAAFDGADPDTRLSNAITAATPGDVIFLEAADYDSSRTINTALSIIGTDPNTPGGSTVRNTWTITSSDVSIQSVGFRSSGELLINSPRVRVQNGYHVGNGITVDADSVLLEGLYFADITFNGTTSGGLVDSGVGLSVTDNGTNTVGDT